MLKIHKKHLLRVEQYTKFGYGGSFYPYSCRYVFLLPDNSNYKDYAIYIDTEDCKFEKYGKLLIESVGANYELKGNYYFLNLNEENLTAFKCLNREPGKRYKRYTLSINEIYSLYNYNEDLSDLPYAIAYVTQYLNNGRKNAGEVVSKYYRVGKISNNWIYFDNEKKINSRGIEILGKIPFEKKQEVDSIIEKYYVELKKIDLLINDAYGENNKLQIIYDKAINLENFSVMYEIIECVNKEKLRIKNTISQYNEKIISLENTLQTNFKKYLIK